MQKNRAKKLTTIAILSAISVVLSFLELPLPMLFPGFLKIDLADIPALVGIIFYGFDVGILIPLIKNLVSTVITNTSFGIGEFVNFVVCVSFIVPFYFCYKKNKTNKSFLFSAVFGVLLMTIIASLLNYFVTIPLYTKVFGLDIVAIGKAINNNINSLKDFIVLSIVPFNILKGAIVSAFSYLVISRLKI